MPPKLCFICCKLLTDNSTCSDNNASTQRSLKAVLEIVGISYESFVRDLHQDEDCEIFDNDIGSFCGRCCNLIDIAEDLRKSLLVVKQKFVDRVAAGYQRRLSTENLELGNAKGLEQAANRLGQCFTRSTVIIRPEDAVPLEKLKSVEPMEIVQPKEEIEEVIILNDDVDHFSDGFEPEVQAEDDAPPPIKRRKVKLPKQTLEQTAGSHTAVVQCNMDDKKLMKRRRQSRRSHNSENVVLEPSSENDVWEPAQDKSSSENSDSSSSEGESEVISDKKKRDLQRARDHGRALQNARFRKGELSSIRFRCGLCSLTWAVMYKLDWHVKNEHGAVSLLDRPFGCAICPATFRTFEDLKNHVIHYTIAKGYKEECRLCKFSDDVPVLTGHYFKEHGLDFLKGKYFGCVRCLQTFKPTEAGARSGFVSPDDIPAFKSFAEEHRSCSSPKELTVSQKCRICPETRLTAAELISHEVTHFPGLHCTYCDFEFKNENALEDHNSFFHGEYAGCKPREVKPRLPNMSCLRTSRCEVCRKCFSNEKKLAAHAVIHAAEKNVDKETDPSSKYDRMTVEFKCFICEKSLVAFHSKKLHTISVHNLKLFRRLGGCDVFCSCVTCLAPFLPNGPMELPGPLLLKDKEKFLKFAAEHAVCNREPISEFTCTQCQAVFTEPTELFKHILESHAPPDENYPCEHCKSEFDSNVEYLHHLRQQHSEQIKLRCQCYRCGKQFKDVETLQAHVLESSTQLQCPSCDQSFKGSESYQKHKCALDQIPGPKEVRSTEVPSHSMQLNCGFPCLSCKEAFHSVALLSLHFQEHHDKAEELNFNCRICSTTLKTSETLRKNGEETFYSTNDNFEHVDFTSLCAQHWKTCIANQDATPCSEIEEPLFDCYVCQKGEDSPQSLAVHLNEHHGVEEVYRCQACSSIFSTKRFLENHLNLTHNLKSHQSEQYYCRCCWEPFQSIDPEMKLGAVAEQDLLQFQTFLDRHFQCKAAKVKRKCRHCLFEGLNLFVHYVNVHSNRHKVLCHRHYEHYCERCGKGYSDLCNLNIHTQCHEIEDGKREKLTCEICGKTFKSVDCLKQHLTTHDDKRPQFVCQYCAKPLSTKSSLMKHEKKHCAVKRTEALKSSAAAECESDVGGDGEMLGHKRALASAEYQTGELSRARFRCGKCPTTCVRIRQLNLHVKNVHRALSLLDRPFGCAICPAMFRTVEDLKNHVIHYTIAKGYKEECRLCEFSDDLPVLTGHYFKEHGLDFLKGKYFGCVQCLRAFEPTEGRNRCGFVGPDDLPAFKSFAEEHRSCSSQEELTALQKCRICPETKLTAAELISHESTHFPELNCTLCDFEFKTERTLEAHNRTHHSRKFAGDKPNKVKPLLPNQCSFRPSRCTVCGKWCSNEEKLAAHAETHAAEENTEKGEDSPSNFDEALDIQCLICGYKVSRLRFFAMNRHMKAMHNLELFRRYGDRDTFCSCFACLAPFEPNDPMELPGRLLLKDKEKFLKFAAEHAVCNREAVSEFKCTQCQAEFTEPKLLFKHIIEMHLPPDENKYSCKECQIDFDSNVEHLQHMRRKHAQRIKMKCQCYRCGKQFKDVETLQAHVLESSKQLQCPGCDQNFKGLESYQKHKCKFDPVPAPEEIRLTEAPSHSFQLNGGFPCLSCKEAFQSVALLSLHFQEHHDKAEELTFNCRICSVTLKTSETLRKDGEETFYSTNANIEHADFTSLCAQHWKTCIANQDETSCSEIEEPLFECYICHQNQDSPQSLAVHLNEHHGVSEVYRCRACSAIFSTKRFFDNHLNSSHNLKSCFSDQYFCLRCWEPFLPTDPEMKLGAVAEQDMLKFHFFLDRHFQCKAAKVKRKCRHCTYETSKVRRLLEHDVKKHSRKYFKRYCERCGKGFLGIFNLNIHLQTHEIEDGKREKPTCQICGKTFKAAISLKYHLPTHDKQLPFVCQYCGKGFTCKTHLTRHEKNHTAVKPTEATVPCPICGKLFVNLPYMKYHVTFTHEKRLKRKKPEKKSAKKRPARTHT